MIARSRDRLSRRSILALGSALRGGSLAIREDSGTTVLGHGGKCAHMTVHDERVWGMTATAGGNGLGAAYMRGYWDTPDLTGLLSLLAHNVDRINRLSAPGRGTAPLAPPDARCRPAQHPCSLRPRKQLL